MFVFSYGFLSLFIIRFESKILLIQKQINYFFRCTSIKLYFRNSSTAVSCIFAEKAKDDSPNVVTIGVNREDCCFFINNCKGRQTIIKKICKLHH